MNDKWNFEMDEKTINIYRNLSNQIHKVFRHTRQGSIKTRYRYKDDTGFYLTDDIRTMTPEEIQQRLDEHKKEQKEKEKEAAEKANQERLDQLKKEYIVNGARIICSCCSAAASLVVLPESHGTYIHGLSQLYIKDCTPINIKKFNFCSSPENPKVIDAANEVLEETLNNRKKGFFDRCMDFLTGATNEVESNVKDGLAQYCAAECIFENIGCWKDGKSNVLIDETHALLGRCMLQCKYGGTITLYSNGLENAIE